jgi:hypothetical protein
MPEAAEPTPPHLSKLGVGDRTKTVLYALQNHLL